MAGHCGPGGDLPAAVGNEPQRFRYATVTLTFDGGTRLLVGEDWHPVRERRSGEPQDAGWAEVDADVMAWLPRNVDQGA
jgi:hypothetical protein